MSASSAFHDTFGHGAAGGYGKSLPRASFGKAASPKGAASGRGSRPKQAPLRLTRRGRFVFFGVPLILLAALILSLGGFLNAPAKASESASELSVTPTVSVTVQPGESLWAIAGTVAPERDPRDVVADIVQLNNLDAARVRPGQTLFVPVK
ncbi:LysM peptidoglycan-binding domain-containing protein [Arthrobacter sp. UYCu712]|uniref:LysM peptidoglycan-binding domain-containing protein n=1 Tax=Arthrobacter sp. UYCu712 TaxID=3156340 RepID=UPI003397B6F0